MISSRISSRLLRWYARHGRDLPWRKTKDPYRILVSEIMLQQTQVSRVLMFYRSWLKKFPSFRALARASNADVVRAWSGLGYNRRALLLRDIARAIVRRDAVPNSSNEWRKLKGIGPYTSAALGAFCHHEHVLPIDTNVRRVLGRLLLGTPFPQPNNDQRIRRAADACSVFHDPRFHDVPQALFDLASLVCVKVPRCFTCPFKDKCAAAKKFLSGRVRIPRRMIQKTKESRYRDKPFPNRIYRGRILKFVTKKPVRKDELGRLIDPSFDFSIDQPWLLDMIRRLKRDKLLTSSSLYVLINGRRNYTRRAS